MKQLLKKLFNPTIAKVDLIQTLARLNVALSTTAASFSRRAIVDALPSSWEASGFSQNGEDGITDYLVSKLKNSNKYFIEIGSNNGIENNTSYLAHVKKFSGLQIEGDINQYEAALKTKPWLVDCFNCFVKESSIDSILQRCVHKNPDVFSIDIDGMDYYITKLLFDKGMRPKIVIVEYNSAFGPEAALTLPYNENFNMFKNSFPYLYYGVSLNGWTKFFNNIGYQFVTVESNGVNAFFIDANSFEPDFSSQLQGSPFEENRHQLRLFNGNWERQFEKISKLDFFQIPY